MNPKPKQLEKLINEKKEETKMTDLIQDKINSKNDSIDKFGFEVKIYN